MSAVEPATLTSHPTGAAADVFTIALAGNPNCGKTTIFNGLTGLHYKVANYPGVTVEKKVGPITVAGHPKARLLDLPGIYSLSGNSLDEQIATAALLGQLKNERLPDLIVAVLDASNLERNLYLTTQLIDLGIPLIVALNMVDVATERGISIRTEILARHLGVPVIGLSASKGVGLEQLRAEIDQRAGARAIESGTRFAWLPSEAPFAHAARALGEAERRVHPTPIDDLVVGTALLSESTTGGDETVRAAVITARAELAAAGLDALSFEATARYQWINSVVKKSCTVESSDQLRWSERIDALVTHKIWGSFIFIAVMTLIFQAIFLWASVPMDLIDATFATFGTFVKGILPDGKLESLIVDGIIAGVGAVVIFVPQIALLFFFLGILEETGYLCRAAFLMDRIMRKVGLQGRSFIPLLSSFACAIPGIMSARSIPSFADRLTTILIAPLMSCSARLPVYALLIAAFVPNTLYSGIISLQGLVLLGMYLLGIIGAAVVAWLLKTTLLRGTPALFVMEMPPLRLPGKKVVLRDVLDRIALFLKSAGTMILACSIVLWFLAAYPSDRVEESYAGRIGHAIEPAIRPLGFNWEIGVGLLASFAAREVFVTSLATVYNLESSDDDVSTPLIAALEARRDAGTFTLASALALMVFYVFACQCMSTLAVCRRETNTWRWPVFMFVYMTALAYGAAFITYRIAVALTT
jgi:ferrous iron transport protein B